MKLLLLAAGSAAALMAATPPIVIQNATILTVTKGTFNGSVLIRDGKIAEVGEKVIDVRLDRRHRPSGPGLGDEPGELAGYVRKRREVADRHGPAHEAAARAEPNAFSSR